MFRKENKLVTRLARRVSPAGIILEFLIDVVKGAGWLYQAHGSQGVRG